MKEGEIRNNNGAQLGDGIGVLIEDGLMTMDGGKIHDNKGPSIGKDLFTNGGGIAAGRYGNGNNKTKSAVLTMTDGEIYNNTAHRGGGIFIGGTGFLSGGKIYENDINSGYGLS